MVLTLCGPPRCVLNTVHCLAIFCSRGMVPRRPSALSPCKMCPVLWMCCPVSSAVGSQWFMLSRWYLPSRWAFLWARKRVGQSAEGTTPDRAAHAFPAVPSRLCGAQPSARLPPPPPELGKLCAPPPVRPVATPTPAGHLDFQGYPPTAPGCRCGVTVGRLCGHPSASPCSAPHVPFHSG